MAASYENARVNVAVRGCYPGVGASSVVKRLRYNIFERRHQSSTGITHSTLELDPDDAGVALSFIITDYDSNVKHADLTRDALANAHIIILVVSCIRTDGKDAGSVILDTRKNNPHTPILLVSTHTDLLIPTQDALEQTTYYNKLTDEHLACVVGATPIHVSLPDNDCSRKQILDPLIQIGRCQEQYTEAFEAETSVAFEDPHVLVRASFCKKSGVFKCVRNWK